MTSYAPRYDKKKNKYEQISPFSGNDPTPTKSSHDESRILLFLRFSPVLVHNILYLHISHGSRNTVLEGDSQAFGYTCHSEFKTGISHGISHYIPLLTSWLLCVKHRFGNWSWSLYLCNVHLGISFQLKFQIHVAGLKLLSYNLHLKSKVL